MPFTIVRNDITKMKVSAIVNAANSDLAMGSGVCGAIFQAAGVQELQAACKPLAPIKTGDAVITPGFALPARYIIHTVGPVYRNYSPEESETLLRAAYINSMKLAIENDCESIAFPLISSGIYGYPKDEALRVATKAIRDFIQENDIYVSLVVFNKAAFSLSQELLGEVESYIDEHYIGERSAWRHPLLSVKQKALDEALDVDKIAYLNKPMPELTENIIAAPMRLDDIVDSLDEPFAATLLQLIDNSGKSDAEVYKCANIDRRLFSKIRNNPQYAPSKSTVLAFAIALELNLDQTEDLLNRAGFALSHSRKFDVIVEFFIAHSQYDVFEINEVLFSYDQPLLGG